MSPFARVVAFTIAGAAAAAVVVVGVVALQTEPTGDAAPAPKPRKGAPPLTLELGIRTEDIGNLDFIERGHRGSRPFLSMPAPILVALKGWVIGGSFERALLCDLRVAGESAKMRLPELMHGVIPDTGGTARLFQIAGHGIAADLALTGRVMDAEEALRHGVVSRVVPDEQLDATCLEMAHAIAKLSPFAVRIFRRTLARLANPAVEASIQEEAIGQTLVQASEDYAEFKAARAAKRDPKYRNR